MRWPPRLGEPGRWLATGASVLLHGGALAAVITLGGWNDRIAPDGQAIPIVWEAAVATAAHEGAGEPEAAPAAAPPPLVSAAPAPVFSPPTAADEPEPAPAPAPATATVEPPPSMALPLPPAPRPPQRELAQAHANAEPPAAAEGPSDPPVDTSAPAAPTALVSPSETSQSSTPASPSQSLAAAPAAAGWSVVVRRPPTYPPSARRRGIEGEVLLLAELGNDGSPQSVTLLRSSGYPELDEAAIAAVEKWSFRSAARVTIEIPIVFRLEGDRRDGR